MRAISPNWLNVDLPFPCEIHAARFMTDLSPTTNYRVYVDSWEPRPSCESVPTILANANKFDLILTQDDEVAKLPNARLFVGLESVVYPWEPKTKEYSLSFLATFYHSALEYDIRHWVWAMESKIVSIPTKFWSSKIRPVDPARMLPERTDGVVDKASLFESMFSFCPENLRQRNYFTEKILDCFATKTVPIYWGCPNIGDYFDEDGIIQVNSQYEFIEKVNSLTIDKYYQMKDHVEKNYLIGMKYCVPNLSERVKIEILNFREKST